jgi:hypothetical protein
MSGWTIPSPVEDSGFHDRQASLRAYEDDGCSQEHIGARGPAVPE